MRHAERAQWSISWQSPTKVQWLESNVHGSCDREQVAGRLMLYASIKCFLTRESLRTRDSRSLIIKWIRGVWVVREDDSVPLWSHENTGATGAVGASELRSFEALVPWCFCAFVLWSFVALVLCCFVTMELWRFGVLAFLRLCALELWSVGACARWAMRPERSCRTQYDTALCAPSNLMPLEVHYQQLELASTHNGLTLKAKWMIQWKFKCRSVTHTVSPYQRIIQQLNAATNAWGVQLFGVSFWDSEIVGGARQTMERSESGRHAGMDGTGEWMGYVLSAWMRSPPHGRDVCANFRPRTVFIVVEWLLAPIKASAVSHQRQNRQRVNFELNLLNILKNFQYF